MYGELWEIKLGPATMLLGGLTRLVRVTYANIGSDNGLSPGRHQAIYWTNAGILLMGHLGNSNRKSYFFLQENPF